MGPPEPGILVSVVTVEAIQLLTHLDGPWFRSAPRLAADPQP